MRGFTLLEVLVALVISSIVALMAYGGLDSVLSTRQQMNQHAERLKEIQMFFLSFKRDIEQSVGRIVRDEYGDNKPAFQAAEYGRYRLELSRSGIRNPAMVLRSNIRRVAYGIDSETIQRYTWKHMDRAQDALSVSYNILSGVESIKLRFLDNDRAWHSSWPPQKNEENIINQLPIATEITVELTDWGKLTRLFLMVDY